MGLSIQIAQDKIDMVDRFQVFLSDEVSSHDFLKNKFNIDGPNLETPIGKNGINLYKIKMSEEKHLGNVLDYLLHYTSKDSFKSS